MKQPEQLFKDKKYFMFDDRYEVIKEIYVISVVREFATIMIGSECNKVTLIRKSNKLYYLPLSSKELFISDDFEETLNEFKKRSNLTTFMNFEIKEHEEVIEKTKEFLNNIDDYISENYLEKCITIHEEFELSLKELLTTYNENEIESGYNYICINNTEIIYNEEKEIIIIRQNSFELVRDNLNKYNSSGFAEYFNLYKQMLKLGVNIKTK